MNTLMEKPEVLAVSSSRSARVARMAREAAKRIHPDLATDPADRERRTRFMADANRAYETGDAEALQRILDEYQDGADFRVQSITLSAQLRNFRRAATAENRAEHSHHFLVQ